MNKIMCKYALAILLIFAVNPLWAQSSYFADWESGTWDSGLAQAPVPNYSINGISDVTHTMNALHNHEAIQVSWARGGDYVLKVYADGSNYGTSSDYAWRSELAFDDGVYDYYDGDELYYSMSFRPPSQYWDNVTKYSIIISQWKMVDGGPHAELRLSNLGDYELTFEGPEIGTVSLGTVTPDQWTDVKVYFKKSLGSDGITKVWINGELKYSRNGKNIERDKKGYTQIGMYTETRDERVLYMDNVEIAHSISTSIDEWAATTPGETNPGEPTAGAAPKNVILFIGDGMGPQQVLGGSYYVTGQADNLSFHALGVEGRMGTSNAGGGTTDSAAGGTAIAAGQKVNNGVISIAEPGDGSDLKTVLEVAQDAGKMVGMISTDGMDAATPAVFAAHAEDRGDKSDIEADYLVNKPNILFGKSALSTSKFSSAGYTVVSSESAVMGLNADNEDHVLAELSFSSGSSTLANVTEKALDILDNDPDGLFLTIEEAVIDKAGHSNDIEDVMDGVKSLDLAVQRAVAYVDDPSNPLNWSNTLLIVTADHETGDLTITKNNGIGNYPSVDWGSTSHTGIDVPVFAKGVNADKFAGNIENSDVKGIIESDGVAPLTASITNPLNGDEFAFGDGISIDAITTGFASSVEFFDGSSSIGIDSNEPYSIVWNNAPMGHHELTAVVTATDGKTSTSAPVSISVIDGSRINYAASKNGGSISAFSAEQTDTPHLAAWAIDNSTDPEDRWSVTGFPNWIEVDLGADVQIDQTELVCYKDRAYQFTVEAKTDGGTYSTIVDRSNNTVGGSVTSPITDNFLTTARFVKLTVTGISPADASTWTSIIEFRVIGDKDVTPNEQPTASLTAPANNSVFQDGDDITVTANASDNDGTIMQVESFAGPISLGIDTDGSDGWSVAWNNAGAGQYVVKAIATDDRNATGESAVINVKVNQAPEVTITDPHDGDVIAPGSDITIDTSAKDNDGGVVKVEFRQNGSLIGTDTDVAGGWNIVWSNVQEGAYTLTATVTDTDGSTDVDQISVTVGATPLLPPTVSISAPASVAVGTDVSVSAVASDSDGTVSSVEFLVDGTSESVDYASPYNATISGLTVGTYTITAVATDNDGLTASAGVTVEVTDAGTPVTTTLTAIDDVNINEASPSSNNNFSKVTVRGLSGSQIVGLVKFDISSIAGTVQDAKFRFYTAEVNGAVPISIYRTASGSWSESSVTWNSAPSKGSLVTTLSVSTLGTYYEFDVTPFVSEKVGSSDMTFWVEESSNSGNRIKFNSHILSNAPELVITSASSLKSSVTGSAVSNVNAKVNTYPNPVTDVLNIEVAQGASIEIYSIVGQKVIDQLATGDQVTQIDVNQLSAGTYILVVKNGKIESTTKFIKF